ncbi:hypothetical protein ES1_07290 [[Eubacterium] siraeum V10Sc8a]|uniref:Uncharacterized protein n=1 Tax=[Eubacterium] siraeum V10Sc8a TaxID=717961 RepID=D4MJ97_9FIRM|nr:hypothetical protein ES1_07290 [[Eubacterium] siraeum V10Sc8a]
MNTVEKTEEGCKGENR